MKQRILIVGVGFTGMWSALDAVRQFDRQGRDDIEVAVLAPQPELYIRPRFYEPDVQRMAAPLGKLFAAVGVRFVQGNAQRIGVTDKRAKHHDAEGTPTQLDHDRLVLATGGGVWRPASVVGIDAIFDVDQSEDALRLEAHLYALRDSSDSSTHNTVVVAGDGFTGIETATEIPARLWAVPGEKATLQVIVVDRGAAIGASVGADLSGLIVEASTELGVERCLGRSVATVDAEGVTPSDGQRIEVKTMVWAVGVRASILTGQIPGERDAQGRLRADRNLKVFGLDDVYATGDVARAVTDDLDNYALMTCQHAIALGRSADNNVVADLFGVEPTPYSQMRHVTCFDLGDWGAVFTEGWDRQVRFVHEEGKKIKTEINDVWIYPPAADRVVALAAADPLVSVVV